MPRSKNINLFLLDGTAQGRVKCTLANWTGVAYKIPRTMLKECRGLSLLDQTGVYFLFGESEKTGEPLVYVGQAGIRKNGKGILCRLNEHVVQGKKDWWNIAIAFTTSNNSFGPTEISYLENCFYRMAIEAKRFVAQNDNEPNPGNLTEEKVSELKEYMDYASLVISVLGFPVFSPLRNTESSSDSNSREKEEPILYCARATVDAKGQRTSEGFVVFEGSRIRPDYTHSCPDGVKKLRAKYANLISPDHVVLSDILFSSPSTAAGFVCGASSNGRVEWKTQAGITLKDWENTQQMSSS